MIANLFRHVYAEQNGEPSNGPEPPAEPVRTLVMPHDARRGAA